MRNGLLVVGAATCVLAATFFCLQNPLGFMLTLISICVVSILLGWRKWSAGRPAIGGAPALLFVSGVVVYVAGSIQLGSEIIYGGSISAQQWFLYAVSACAAVIGIALGRLSLRRRSDAELGAEANRTPLEYGSFPLILAFVVGMGVIWVNFATGSIPLLSDSINEARKEGVGGVLASYSWLGFSLAQFVIIAGFSLRFRGLRGWIKCSMIFVSIGSLVLTGSRSFLVLPVLALLITVVEFKRPRLWTVVASSLTFLSVVSVLGSIRGGISGESSDLAVNAERFGYGTGVMASVLSTLQPGPGVLAATLETVPSVVPFQNGAFALRDFPYLIGGQKADYWVTTVILGRDADTVGGLPPTLIGGLYIDFGIVGVVMGIVAVFYFVCRFQPKRVGAPVGAGFVTYSFLVAYLVTTFYSYLSFKINTVVVLVMLGLVALSTKRGITTPRERQRVSERPSTRGNIPERSISRR